MLIGVSDDRRFQRYLDRMEQELHVALYPVMVAAIRLQVNRNAVRAENYMRERGAPLLLRHYRRIYRDQFKALDALPVEEKAARRGLSAFMTEQLAWMAIEAGSRITGISGALARIIAARLIDMVREGRSNAAIAREIQRLAPQIGRQRAARIARTETHNAALAAIEAAAKFRNTPIQTKTWWTAQDERVRDSHAAVHGQTVAWADAFSVGGALMRRPGDQTMGAGAEEVVNCRCSLLLNYGGTAPIVVPPPGPPPEIDLQAARAAAAAEAEDYVRQRGLATGVEHLRWIDYATGQLIDDTNTGTTNYVQFTDAMRIAMADRNRQIEAHHNHPSGSSFSSQDLAVLGDRTNYPGLVRLFAHGHDGSRYLASEASSSAGDALNVLRASGIGTEFFAGSQGFQVLAHARVTAVERVGMVKYDYQLSADLDDLIKRNRQRFNTIVDEMAQTLRRQMKEAKAISILCPAFIDPPGDYASIQEWRAYRDELLRSDLPAVDPFIREANRAIARLIRDGKAD